VTTAVERAGVTVVTQVVHSYAPLPESVNPHDLESHKENFAQAVRLVEYAGDAFSPIEGLITRELLKYLAANFDPRKFHEIEDDIRLLVTSRLEND